MDRGELSESHMKVVGINSAMDQHPIQGEYKDTMCGFILQKLE